MIVLDTNLLIYLHRRDVPEHKRCTQLIAKKRIADFATTIINVTEFCSVVTSPGYSTHPSTADDCALFFSQLQSQLGLKILGSNTAFVERLLEHANARQKTGRQFHDLAIATLALEAGAKELWTHDATFAVPAGLRVTLPLKG